MSKGDLKERLEYLTSLRLFTSDRYGIWGWDILIVIISFFVLLFGIGDYELSGYIRLALISAGAFFLLLSAYRIDRRYAHFKDAILREIEDCQSNN